MLMPRPLPGTLYILFPLTGGGVVKTRSACKKGLHAHCTVLCIERASESFFQIHQTSALKCRLVKERPEELSEMLPFVKAETCGGIIKHGCLSQGCKQERYCIPACENIFEQPSSANMVSFHRSLRRQIAIQSKYAMLDQVFGRMKPDEA